MQTVLLSIHEGWWNKIKSGEKTLEIRKTAPKNVEYPFKVLCYVTGGKGILGEFICNSCETTSILSKELCKRSCLSVFELDEYAKGKDLVAWDVSNVKSYDVPIQLSDLGINRAPQSWCYLRN